MFICNNCIHKCKRGLNTCVNFENKVTIEELKELNSEIRRQNLNVKRFCRKNGLSYKYLIKALKGKCEFTYKQLYKINQRLNEKDEWIYETERFESNNEEMNI